MFIVAVVVERTTIKKRSTDMETSVYTVTYALTYTKYCTHLHAISPMLHVGATYLYTLNGKQKIRKAISASAKFRSKRFVGVLILGLDNMTKRTKALPGTPTKMNKVNKAGAM